MNTIICEGDAFVNVGGAGRVLEARAGAVAGKGTVTVDARSVGAVMGALGALINVNRTVHALVPGVAPAAVRPGGIRAGSMLTGRGGGALIDIRGTIITCVTWVAGAAVGPHIVCAVSVRTRICGGALINVRIAGGTLITGVTATAV